MADFKLTPGFCISRPEPRHAIFALHATRRTWCVGATAAGACGAARQPTDGRPPRWARSLQHACACSGGHFRSQQMLGTTAACWGAAQASPDCQNLQAWTEQLPLQPWTRRFMRGGAPIACPEAATPWGWWPLAPAWAVGTDPGRGRGLRGAGAHAWVASPRRHQPCAAPAKPTQRQVGRGE